MKHELKNIEHSAVELKFILTPDEFAPIKNNIIKTLAEKADIPGFRKGHAPLSKIEVEFADDIKHQLIEEILKNNFPKVIEEEKLSPVSYIYNLNDEIKDNNLELTFNVDIYPEITLGEYKGLEVEKKSFTMTDDLLNKEIENIINSKTKMEDAPKEYQAKNGDTVDLAFEGFVDGVAFEGGKADSHQLVLGSKSFIDTFEEQLIGYTVGQEGEINVTFPEKYHAEALAGKPAVFKVKINAIKIPSKPELNDELAKELGFESVEDLKAKKTIEITQREENKLKNEFTGKLIQKIVESSKIDVPKSMVVREIENRIGQMKQQLSMQGMDYNKYLEMTGMNEKQVFDQIAPMANNKIQVDLILEAIAKAEKLEITDAELEAKQEEVAKKYGMTKEQLITELTKNKQLEAFKESLKAESLSQKAIEIIVNNVK